MSKLSVVLAVRNEEENLDRCLAAVASIADEIIVFDEYSTDKTVEIAKKYGAKVYEEEHHDNFHITKQKAIEKATGDWILQLDADEVVSNDLAAEIKSTLLLTDEEIVKREIKDKTKRKLFKRHQEIIELRDKLNFNSGSVAAFMIPRRNMFLGKPLTHAGVYPDPAIRLIKNGKAFLPAKSVHEIMQVNGRVCWLENDLLHYDSPNLKRYLDRANRYTSFTASQFEQKKLPKNIGGLFNYSFVKPLTTFISLYFRHSGYKDGIRGFLWSAFSAWHFPLAYYKYWFGVQ